MGRGTIRCGPALIPPSASHDSVAINQEKWLEATTSIGRNQSAHQESGIDRRQDFTQLRSCWKRHARARPTLLCCRYKSSIFFCGFAAIQRPNNGPNTCDFFLTLKAGGGVGGGGGGRAAAEATLAEATAGTAAASGHSISSILWLSSIMSIISTHWHLLISITRGEKEKKKEEEEEKREGEIRRCGGNSIRLLQYFSQFPGTSECFLVLLMEIIPKRRDCFLFYMEFGLGSASFRHFALKCV